MKPDLILTATPSDRRLLTPLSIFGKMVIKDIEGFPSIGSALLLTQEQSFFVTDVLNSWGYTVKQSNLSCQQKTVTSTTTKVRDTRPRLVARPFKGFAENFFPNQNGSDNSLTKRQMQILNMYANYRPANPWQIELPLNSYPQLTLTNDYPINCSHNTGSPHTTKITREKITQRATKSTNSNRKRACPLH